MIKITPKEIIPLDDAKVHQPEKGEKPGAIDSEVLLTDLKKREALLQKLINDGHGGHDIENLKATLHDTISELEAIINQHE